MLEEKFSFDKKRARKVFSRLEEALQRKEKIFSVPDIFPEEKLTKYFPTDSLEFRLLLFLVINHDHRIQSNSYYKKIVECIEDGLLADPKKVLGFNKNQVHNLVRQRLGLAFRRSPDAMIQNIELLKQKYDSDPLNIFRGETDVNEAKKKLYPFALYGVHTSGLLMTFYLKYDVIKFPNQNEIRVKMDINKLRALYDTGVFVPAKGYEWGRISKEPVMHSAVDVICEVCNQANLDTVWVSEGLWVIGEHISSMHKFDPDKRYSLYFVCNPLLKYADTTKFLDLPTGKKNIARINRKRIEVKGRYIYCQTIDLNHKPLF